MLTNTSVRVAVCLLLGRLFITGCAGGGKLSKANIDKVKKGMIEEEVKAVLGPSAESARIDKIRTLVWKEGAKVLTVTLVDGKVTDVEVK
jgi:hypothetical protein